MSELAPELPENRQKLMFWRKKVSTHQNGNSEMQEKPEVLPYFLLFKYTNLRTRLLFLFSVICAVAHGTSLPILVVVFGAVLDRFGNVLQDESSSQFVPPSEIKPLIGEVTRIFLILSFVVFVVAFFQLFFALMAANATGNDLRARFFDSLIRQHPTFYDNEQAGALTNLVVNDINIIQAGVGDKLATATQYLTTFVTGIIVGFVKGWLLTIVVLAVTPVVLIAGSVFGNASSEASADGLGSYSSAAGLASESLGLIRTVTAFSAQKTEARRYDEALEKSYKASARSTVISGIGLGVAMFVILCTYGLAFWFGSLRVTANDMSGGDVMLVFFAITLGASSLGTAGPAFKSFIAARAAAPRVFEIIDAVSAIDPLDDSEDSGIIPEGNVNGQLSFRDVDFMYSRRSGDGTSSSDDASPNLVLKSFSLDIPAGSSEAFVGKSGSGKSTVARLIQRFYDPVGGTIMLDGVDIRELNVRWLRSQIGVVAQMPSLFAMSIRDNIALGAGVFYTKDQQTGKANFAKQEVTEEDIIAAAKLANAHEFISKLPEGYDTMLGERGAMLSGGQKQRVCIARALVRNPKILLLDESTASLDTASERIVQEALERAASGRTTITIAHRLSTVRNSDSISCIQDGRVIERGDHDALMSRDDGFYRRLFDLQLIQKAKLVEEMKADEIVDDEAIEKTAEGETVGKTNTEKVTADSVTKLEQIDDSEKKERAVDKRLFLRTMRVNKSEWPFMVFGAIGAIAAAVVWPLASVALVRMIELLADKESIDSVQVRNWSLVFVGLAGLALVGNGFQHSLLGISGERLTKRLRSQLFRAMLKQEMGFFDMKENSLGALTGRLSTEAGAVKGLTGDLFGVGLNVVGALIAGLAISFSSCWRITLVVLAIIPGVVLGAAFEMQASAGIDSGAKKEFAAANIVAAEAIDNIVTVRSLGAEEYFVNKFNSIVGNTASSKRRKDIVTSIGFGFSEFCQYLIWFATFEAGGDFVSKGQCEFPDMLRASMALLFAAITLGNVSVFAPDLAESNLGATAVYRLLDRESKIDPSSEEGEPMSAVRGDVKAKDLFFEYPRRPDVRVLRGLSLEVARGKTLAIVGTSGHGKSTIISLLERFYSPRKGSVTIDDQEIVDSRVQDVRSQIGLVSQEPDLFDRSVFENISYGLPHEEGTTVTMEQVVAAAKLANAHDFISELSEGYDTIVGARGDKLSGGQKQRVAIARSLVRQPPVLLLDEATSALDGASEQQVQKALEQAGGRQTTLVVAHRLSTIRNADLIVVIRRGRVVESGTHDTLLRKNGAYAKLVENQLTDV